MGAGALMIPDCPPPLAHDYYRHRQPCYPAIAGRVDGDGCPLPGYTICTAYEFPSTIQLCNFLVCQFWGDPLHYEGCITLELDERCCYVPTEESAAILDTVLGVGCESEWELEICPSLTGWTYTMRRSYDCGFFGGSGSCDVVLGPDDGFPGQVQGDKCLPPCGPPYGMTNQADPEDLNPCCPPRLPSTCEDPLCVGYKVDDDPWNSFGVTDGYAVDPIPEEPWEDDEAVTPDNVCQYDTEIGGLAVTIWIGWGHDVNAYKYCRIIITLFNCCGTGCNETEDTGWVNLTRGKRVIQPITIECGGSTYKFFLSSGPVPGTFNASAGVPDHPTITADVTIAENYPGTPTCTGSAYTITSAFSCELTLDEYGGYAGECAVTVTYNGDEYEATASIYMMVTPMSAGFANRDCFPCQIWSGSVTLTGDFGELQYGFVTPCDPTFWNDPLAHSLYLTIDPDAYCEESQRAGAIVVEI